MTFINFAEAELDSQLASTDANFDVIMTSSIYDLEDDKKVAILTGGGRLTIIHAETGQPERMQWASVSALSDASDGRKRYRATFAIADDTTTKLRGLANTGDGTTAVANVIAGNIIASIPQGSKVYFSAVGSDDYNQLAGSFQAGTALDATHLAGETLLERDSVSIHTDGKIYKYHKTNYPNLYGIANAGYAVDATVTTILGGGAKSGFTGLTQGALVYAENTGAVTQTASTTTYILGRAQSDTIVRVGIATSDLQPATASEIAAGAGTGVTSVTDVVALSPSYKGTVLENVAIAQPLAVFGFCESASATTLFGVRIGYNSSLQRHAVPVFFDGTSISTLVVKMKKQGTPSDNIVLRIETDNAGEPSGTLADANATANIAVASVVDGDNTFTLSSAVALTRFTKYWAVFSKAGATSTSNFYLIYSSASGRRSSYSLKYVGSAWDDSAPYWISMTCSAFDSGFFKGNIQSEDDNQSSDFVGIAHEAITAGADKSLRLVGQQYGGFTGLKAGHTYEYDGSDTISLGTQGSFPNNTGMLIALDATTLMYK